MRILVGVIPYFFFLSLASHLARILAMQTMGQVVGKRLTTVKVRRLLRCGWLEEILCKFWRFMLIHAGILCCAGVQINIQTSRVEISSRPLWNLALSPSGHLLSEYVHYHWLRCCVSLSDFDISKLRDQWSWRFFRGQGAPNRSFTTVGHSVFKTYPKISNSEFLSKS